MSYRYDKQQRQKKQRYFLIAIIFLLSFFTPFYQWLFTLVERPLAQAWEAKQRTFDRTENFFHTWYGKLKIVEENKKLKQEISRLKIDQLRLEAVEKENNQLYQLQEDAPDLLAAKILHYGVLGNRDTLLIHQGKNNKLERGDLVYAQGHVLIGFVSTVYDSTAEVTLYGKSGQKIFGRLYPRMQTLEAVGQGKGSFLIETPREVEVEIGDIFYSLNERGAIIAIVREIVFDPRDPFKQVYLSYPLNINEIELVGVQRENNY